MKRQLKLKLWVSDPTNVILIVFTKPFWPTKAIYSFKTPR